MKPPEVAGEPGEQPPRVSLIIPLWNERESVAPLCAALREALDGWTETWEALLVDDGSSDGTADLLRSQACSDRRFRVLRLRRNSGQTQALAAGFRCVRGEVVVTLDGDLQNDPRDIPMLVAILDRGFDVVCGWRWPRRDPWLTRKVPSAVANWMISRLTGVRIHDSGCSLKAYRAGVIRSLEIYADMHRFLPALAAMSGARITETVVRHHRRRFGRSKYGLGRIARVLADTLTIKMLTQFSVRPAVWFVILAAPWAAAGIAVALLWLARLWVLGRGGSILYPSLSVILLYTAAHTLSLGVLGELLLRQADHRGLRRLPEALATVEEIGAP